MTDAEGNEIGKVFIGGLSQSTNDDSLRNYFCQYGCIEDCVVMMDNKTGRSRGFGYIKFDDERTVMTVLESAPHLLDGKIVDVKQCNVHMKGRNRRSLKIFVGGIGLDDNEESIRKFFSQFGNVTDVNLMLDQAKQRHRGFAFVGFEDETVVKDLIIRHFVSMNGKHVEIKAMEPPNFARKLLSSESGSSTIITNSTPGMQGMIFCNSLSTDQQNSDEKMLRLSPQYSLQPVVWSNTSSQVVNSNAVWANPYQFDKVTPNFLYQQQPPPPPCHQHFHSCVPNANQPMWGMMPSQSPGPWGYQVPLSNNNVYQYSALPANTWQYPYVLQYPPHAPAPACVGEKSSTVEFPMNGKLSDNNVNAKCEDSTQGDGNLATGDASRIYDAPNNCWSYCNKDVNSMNLSSRSSNEHIMRPNGDDNMKNAFNAPLTDFSFFQPHY